MCQATATDGVPSRWGRHVGWITLPVGPLGSAAQAELLDELAVPVLVLSFQVVKQLATLVNHLQETSPKCSVSSAIRFDSRAT